MSVQGAGGQGERASTNTVEDARAVGIGGLPPGSVVVERYVYISPHGKPGVQWLAQVVEDDGSLALIQACETRREALKVLEGIRG